MTSAISVQDTIIYVMVSISAVDRSMSDEEMLHIGNIVKTLPVFEGYSPDRLVEAAKDLPRHSAGGGRSGHRA